MDNQSWDKAKRIFADAIKVSTAKRLAFLDAACGDDVVTRRKVESLLNSVPSQQRRRVRWRGRMPFLGL